MLDDVSISVGPLDRAHLIDADRIFRLAFAAFLEVENPLEFMTGREVVRGRFETDPSGVLAATSQGELIGSNIVTNWGSFGWFGPLTVHPTYWSRGVGSRLLEPTMELFAVRGTRVAALFTFADSPKHQGLYQKFDFWPRFLTAVMKKQVSAERLPLQIVRFSLLQSHDREASLEATRELGDRVFDGLDLRQEIRAVQRLTFGDTVFLFSDAHLEAFAICHFGEKSEAAKDTCYIKFAAVRPGMKAQAHFDLLLHAVEGLAREKGLSEVEAGVNLERFNAYRALLQYGFRTSFAGVIMMRRNEVAYNRSDIFVMDDLR